jgi:hypothetical protein
MDKKQTLLFRLEQDIATLILDKLENFEITFERASQIAKFILAHLPDNITDAQIMSVLPSLDDNFTELAGIVHRHMVEYEEKHKEEAVKHIQDLIKHEHFQEASNQATDYFNRKHI